MRVGYSVTRIIVDAYDNEGFPNVKNCADRVSWEEIETGFLSLLHSNRMIKNGEYVFSSARIDVPQSPMA
jgi:hypothetical protein